MTPQTLTAVDADALGAAQARFRRLRLDAFRSRGFNAHEHYVVCRDGRRVYTLVAGEGACPTLLVHSGVANTAEWAPLAPLLGGRVIVPDTPGFGLSERPAAGYSDLAALSANWIREVADALHAERLNIVGCSLGGYAAICFATTYPERANRLVLSGSAGGLFQDIGTFLKLWTLPGIGKLVSNAPMRNINAVRKLMLGPYVGDPESLPDDLLEVALAGVNLPGSRSTSREIIRSIANRRGWKPEHRAEDLLAGSDIPTTFVWGDHDVHAQPAVAAALANRMHNATVALIPGAGHIPHLDHPNDVAHEISAQSL